MSGFLGPSTPGLVHLPPEMRSAVHSECDALAAADRSRDALIQLCSLVFFGVVAVGLAFLMKRVPVNPLPLVLIVWLIVVAKLIEPPRRERVRRTVVELGFCPECGYDLTGLPSDRCPECGWVVPEPVRRKLHERGDRPLPERDRLLHRAKARGAILNRTGGVVRIVLRTVFSAAVFIALVGVAVSRMLIYPRHSPRWTIEIVYWLAVLCLAIVAGLLVHGRIIQPADRRTRRTICGQFGLCDRCFDRVLKTGACPGCGRRSDQFPPFAAEPGVECASQASTRSMHDSP